MSFIILFIIVNLITLLFSIAVEKYWFPETLNKFWNKLETPFKIYGKETAFLIYPFDSWIGVYYDRINKIVYVFPVFGLGFSMKLNKDVVIERVRAYRPVKAGSMSSEKLNEDPPTGGTGFVADTELKVVKKIIKCDGKEFKLEKNYMMGKELYELLGVDPSKKVLKAWASQWSTESFLCGGEQLFFVPDGMEYHTSDIPAPKPVNVFFGGNLVELESNRMKGIELYEALNCNAEKYKLWLAGKEYVEPNESEVKILDRMQIYSSTRKITANLKTEDIELRFEKKSFYVKSEGYYPNLLLYILFDVNPKTHNLWFYDNEKGEDVLVETGEGWKMDIRKNRYFSSSPKKDQ